MGAPNKPRKKVQRGKATHPGRPELFKKLWADPEWKAKKIADMKARNSRSGIPDGMTKKQAQQKKQIVREKADFIMSELEKNGVVSFDPNITEDQMAREALKGAFEIAMFSGAEQTRLQAQRLILDHTHAKPVSKNELTLNNSDEWLKAVIADHKEDAGNS
jgi:hypothetical protein